MILASFPFWCLHMVLQIFPLRLDGTRSIPIVAIQKSESALDGSYHIRLNLDGKCSWNLSFELLRLYNPFVNNQSLSLLPTLQTLDLRLLKPFRESSRIRKHFRHRSPFFDTSVNSTFNTLENSFM
jgi:hypothetical protein